MPRRIDSAMAVVRPAKDAIRGLWVDLAGAASVAGYDGRTPLYLTLAGAEGKDLQLLVERGILRRTEVGAIVPEDQKRFVAIESNPLAVLELQRRFPGLKILDVPLQNILRSTNPCAWPDGEAAKFCRARVINLDFNAPLEATLIDGQVKFPSLILISKLAQLHAADPHLDWSLCLTFNGSLTWSDAVWRGMLAFLAENFGRDGSFYDACRTLLGTDICSAIAAGGVIERNGLSPLVQQKFLMALVPKKINEMVYTQGWRVETRRNLRYGGSGGTAPMVSWIIDFSWDSRVSVTPGTVYIESLRTILVGAGQIAEDGSLLQE